MTNAIGPLVVGIGGTLGANSSTERALRRCLESARRQGGRTKLYCGGDIELPMYNPHEPARTTRATALINALREADAGAGLIPDLVGRVLNDTAVRAQLDPLASQVLMVGRSAVVTS